jgi:hypothetical protein
MSMAGIHGQTPDEYEDNGPIATIDNRLEPVTKVIDEIDNHPVTALTNCIIKFGKIPSRTEIVHAISMGMSMDNGASLIP